jgi:DNA-binding response OmpR family regulator
VDEYVFKPLRPKQLFEAITASIEKSPNLSPPRDLISQVQ